MGYPAKCTEIFVTSLHKWAAVCSLPTLIRSNHSPLGLPGVDSLLVFPECFRGFFLARFLGANTWLRSLTFRVRDYYLDGCGDMYVGTNVDVCSAEWWVPASSPAPSLAILSWWKLPSLACSCVEDRDFVNKESGYFVVVKLCQNQV